MVTVSRAQTNRLVPNPCKDFTEDLRFLVNLD